MIYQTCRHGNRHSVAFCFHRRITRLSSVAIASICHAGVRAWLREFEIRGLDDHACALRAIRAVVVDAAAGATGEAPPLERCLIYTSSRAVADGFNEQLPNWVRRNWKTASGTPVVHADDYRLIHERLRALGASVVFAKHHETWPEYQDLLSRVPVVA